MKIKNFKWNKKRLLSLLVIGGITLGSIGNAEILSYNSDVYTKDGDPAKIYFSKVIDGMKYAYISSGNMVGFVYEDDLYMNNAIPNNYFIEDNESISVVVDTAYLYQTPNINDNKRVGIVHKNDVVDIMARTNDGWYIVYINGISGFMHESSFIEKNNEETVTVAKITGNNVRVRYSPTTKGDNIIGFCDVTDSFKIIGKDNDWYIIDYLGYTGYVYEKYVKEIDVNKNDLEYTRNAYLKQDSYFCTDLNTNYGITLPAYQNVCIISEVGDYYKVNVDGVIGYILKNHIGRLTKTNVVVDLGRQILKVFKDGKEIFRAHIISGRKSMQTQVGCFKIGHMEENYQLTPDYNVEYWIQYDDNRGIHEADEWQLPEYYDKVAENAYENFARGHAKTYPFNYGSHGCDNMQGVDAAEVYRLMHVGDNVLIIEPNNLIKDHIISKINTNEIDIFTNEVIKVKRLV